MDKLKYEKPSLKNIADVSYGDCVAGTVFAAVCVLPGSVADGSCGAGASVTGACIPGTGLG